VRGPQDSSERRERGQVDDGGVVASVGRQLQCLGACDPLTKIGEASTRHAHVSRRLIATFQENRTGTARVLEKGAVQFGQQIARTSAQRDETGQYTGGGGPWHA